ncbi:MAG: efflux RND transporter periplasmic adaptor subunit [Proteobacteria bacterium]|nr:efflux RND transporter periplasmic adaptor subunit [Pseudomonadota bacterium]
MTSPDPHATPRVIHGGAMDRKIEAPAWHTRAKLAAAAGGSVLLLIALVVFIVMPGGKAVKVESSAVTVGEVTRGAFEDFVPVRGRVAPLKTVYLDAIEGGRIEKMYVEDGAEVKAGDVLVDLSNTQLRLEVLTREAEVAQQTNNVRTLELNLEQSRLNNRRDMIEAEYQVQKLGRALERRKALFANGNSSKADLENLDDEFNFQKRKFTLLSETLKNTETLQETQLKQIKETAKRLTENLEIARQNLDGLTVRAPVDGKLTAFSAEIGQSLAKGERLGQIDDPGRRKIAADIDEFYLSRVELEQTAMLSWNGKDYTARVAKIYPQVRDGHFVADLVFADAEPADIRRGQTLQLKLTLGDPTEALLIPDGAFFQDTGGAWVFVMAQDGGEAVRRNVRLGRRNSRFIEVLDGLEPGEKVVTSPYTTFLDKDRLQIAANGSP